jgi:hypothetical protein
MLRFSLIYHRGTTKTFSIFLPFTSVYRPNRPVTGPYRVVYRSIPIELAFQFGFWICSVLVGYRGLPTGLPKPMAGGSVDRFSKQNLWWYTHLWLSSPNFYITSFSFLFNMLFLTNRSRPSIMIQSCIYIQFALDHLLYVSCKLKREKHINQIMTFIFSMLAYFPCIMPWTTLVFFALWAIYMIFLINIIYQ